MNEQKSPFDGKMIVVIVLTLAVWMGYQTYLRKKYPDAYKPDAQKEKIVEETKAEAPSAALPALAAATAPATESGATVERTIVVEDQNWKVTVSNRGMGVSDIVLSNYTDRQGEKIRFASTKEALNLETSLIGSAQPIYFQMAKTADQQVTGVADLNGMRILKIYNFDSSRFLIRTSVRVEAPSEAFSGLATKISDTVKKPKSSGFFNPQQEHQEVFVSYEDTNEREVLQPDLEEKKTFHQVGIAALASQYFAFAVIDKSKIIPDFQTSVLPGAKSEGDEETGIAVGNLVHPRLAAQAEYSIEYEAYAGPKSYDFLSGINANLTNLVNFGFFQTIAKWIFRLLQSIHAVVENWGLAIILLTILVRVIVLPFNIMSYRSMKAMAKVQPELKIIREKYKNDPQKANQEILRVMKDAKANPLGGCLPIFLQIPVFFALYQVLGQSIELYKAPFGLWITDLSLKDPFFVLPILMGVAMFVQQKITPSTMEPAQQKVLMFMPIFLTFLLASLPSGLTLYMFVSTLFGVLQQLYFMRDEKRRAAATA